MSLPIPKALYPCEWCHDEYSWPAEDLRWSEKAQGWYCDNCWDDEPLGEAGIRLSEELAKKTLEAR